MMTKLSKTTLKIWFVFFFILSVYRVVFLIYFVPISEHLSFNNIFSALFLGARFDARWAAIPALTFLLLGGFRFISPRNNEFSRSFWILLMTLVSLLIYIILVLDFGNFAYLGEHLTAYIFTLMSNKGEALGMVWESYPVVWLLIALGIATTLSYLRFKRIFRGKIAAQIPSLSKTKRILSFVAVFLFLGIAIFGRFGQYPLRWSLAYAERSEFMGKVVLTPLETLNNTLKFREEVPFQMEQVKKGYNVFRKNLGMSTQVDSLVNYHQTVRFNDPSKDGPTNVVLLICESFAAHMSSSFGNALNTSPSFDLLAKDGVLFDRCFVARRGTAYGVFSTMTGVPDFEEKSTATANPNLINQKILLNQLENYKHFYFIGGSLSWANVRAVLTHNIKDLKTYEELDYQSPRTDVWGVGDYPVMMEANEIFEQQDQAFSAVIQLADNHSPYSIPKEALNAGFVVDNSVSTDSLYKWGFRSIEEYNAYRCFDFSLGEFFKKAKTKKYFENTLFVLIGDHGLESKMACQFPKGWAESYITNSHTPLLFYCPKYLEPKRISALAAQIDVMPSIMHIMNKSYEYSALGRDLFDPVIQQDSNALVFTLGGGFAGGAFGALSKDFYVKVSAADTNQRVLFNFGEKVLQPEEEENLKDSLGDLAVEYYNTARYVVRNNKN